MNHLQTYIYPVGVDLQRKFIFNHLIIVRQLGKSSFAQTSDTHNSHKRDIPFNIGIKQHINDSLLIILSPNNILLVHIRTGFLIPPPNGFIINNTNTKLSMIMSNGIKLLPNLLNPVRYGVSHTQLVVTREEDTYSFGDLTPFQELLLLGQSGELIQQIISIVDSILELLDPIKSFIGELMIMLGLCIK